MLSREWSCGFYLARRKRKLRRDSNLLDFPQPGMINLLYHLTMKYMWVGEDLVNVINRGNRNVLGRKKLKPFTLSFSQKDFGQLGNNLALFVSCSKLIGDKVLSTQCLAQIFPELDLEAAQTDKSSALSLIDTAAGNRPG